MIRYAALLFSLVIVTLGLLGLAAPAVFMDAIGFFQVGQRIYIAAAVRLIVGVVLFLAAADSRWPRAVRVAGFGVIVLGLLTPVSTHPIPSVTWGWWAADFTRPWALSSIALGVFIIAAVVPPRELED